MPVWYADGSMPQMNEKFMMVLERTIYCIHVYIPQFISQNRQEKSFPSWPFFITARNYPDEWISWDTGNGENQ